MLWKILVLLTVAVFFICFFSSCAKPVDEDAPIVTKAPSNYIDPDAQIDDETKPAFEIPVLGMFDGTPLIEGMTPAVYPKINGSTACIPLLTNVMATICGITADEAEPFISVSGGTGAVWEWLMYSRGMAVVYEAPADMQDMIVEKNFDIVPYGLDALVFIVNDDNPVENLSTEQLISIYTGQIKDWNAVGGEKGPIVAYQRNYKSGSQTLFLSLLMKDNEPETPPSEQMPGFMDDLIDAVSTYDGSGGAIGFSVYYYAELMYTYPNLKILSIDGIKPSARTIADGTYPLINEFYLVIDREPQDPYLTAIRQWMLSEDGKQVLIDCGYIPAF